MNAKKSSKSVSKSGTKTCSAKWHTGPKTLGLENFTDAKKYSDGKYPWCIVCSAAYVADRKARVAATKTGKAFTSPLTGRKYAANGKMEVKAKAGKPEPKGKAAKKSAKKSKVTTKVNTRGTVAEMVAATEI